MTLDLVLQERPERVQPPLIVLRALHAREVEVDGILRVLEKNRDTKFEVVLEHIDQMLHLLGEGGRHLILHRHECLEQLVRGAAWLRGFCVAVEDVMQASLVPRLLEAVEHLFDGVGDGHFHRELLAVELDRRRIEAVDQVLAHVLRVQKAHAHVEKAVVDEVRRHLARRPTEHAEHLLDTLGAGVDGEVIRDDAEKLLVLVIIVLELEPVDDGLRLELIFDFSLALPLKKEDLVDGLHVLAHETFVKLRGPHVLEVKVHLRHRLVGVGHIPDLHSAFRDLDHLLGGGRVHEELHYVLHLDGQHLGFGLERVLRVIHRRREVKVREHFFFLRGRAGLQLNGGWRG